jgi:putative membrane protein
VEVEAPVPNSGSGFAPNIIPAALWLGAGVAAFLIHVRALPKGAQNFSGPAKLLGKISIPLLIVLLQAALLYATVVWGLQIHVTKIGLFILTLALSSATFLCIVFALTRLMGDAGKAASMIFLAVQLSSSGGILPVELSGTLFSEISPWLPLTWVVRAMKICMFGAYGNEWQHPMVVIAITCLIALASACWIGRWRYLRPSAMRPAVDF